MAELKTKPTEASPADFIAAIPDVQRRQDCEAVVRMMQEVTGELLVMWSESIIGFGRYVYRYSSGRTGEWMKLGFAPHKDKLTLYLAGLAGATARGFAGTAGEAQGGKGLLVHQAA